MKILGFDPGLHGAYALVDDFDLPIIANLPTFNDQRGRAAKVRTDLDLASLRIALASTTIDHAYIERVSSRPGEGVVSAYRFGHACGDLRGLIVGLGWPYTFVTPQEWQKYHKIGGSPDAARRRAGELFPKLAPLFVKKNSVNMADALLIAMYGVARTFP